MQSNKKTVSFNHISETLIALSKDGFKRKFIAVVGAPASGKSTLASQLEQAINESIGENTATVLAQDGFHLDNNILKSMNRLENKGASDTFDVSGLYFLLDRLKTESEVFAPVFDRSLEISRNCAQKISANHRLIIVEGNYLLLDNDEQWNNLYPLFDCSIFIDVSQEVLQQRLESRWQHYGFSQTEADEKIRKNDLPNALTVIKNSRKADYIFRPD